MEDHEAVEISLAGWSDEQRESFAFLLDEAGVVGCEWRDEVVIVPSVYEQEARGFVDYLTSSGGSEDELRPGRGDRVYSLFEGSASVTISDATPDEVFSFCFATSDDVPRAFADLGEISSVESNERFTVTQETR